MLQRGPLWDAVIDIPIHHSQKVSNLRVVCSVGNLARTFPIMTISCEMSCDEVAPGEIQSLSTGPTTQNSVVVVQPILPMLCDTVIHCDVFGFFSLCSSFTGLHSTARAVLPAASVVVVVAEAVALAAAVVAVIVPVAVADRTDFDPKRGDGRVWRAHSSQIIQSSAQSGCFCRRVQRAASPKDKKSTVSAFLE